MAPFEEFHQAQVNRSIRTIKAELEYLCDASVISPQTLSDLLSRVPAQTSLHAPLSVGAIPTSDQNAGTLQSPPPMNNLNLGPTRTNGSVNEKQDSNYFSQPSPLPTPAAQPPPAYGASPPPQANWAQAPPLAQATALYQYSSTDAGDLELQPNDHITVTEYMNAEWWKGKSSRTGQEGIFPRSYVKIVEEKGPQQNGTSNNYGNMPLDVSGMGNGEGKVPSKTEQQVSLVICCGSQHMIRLTFLPGQEVRQETWQRSYLRCRRNDWWQHCQFDLLNANGSDLESITYLAKDSGVSWRWCYRSICRSTCTVRPRC